MIVSLLILGYAVAFVLGMAFGWWVRGEPKEKD